MLSLFKESIRIVYAIHNVLFPHWFDWFFYDGLIVVIYQSDEFLRPQASEFLLHFAENRFYWIVVRWVCDVEYVSDSKFSHRLFAFVGSMRGQIIHEEADLCIAILFS